MVRCPEGKTGVVALPEGITKINSKAFNNCTAVTDIIIPEGVTEISRYTFQNCNSLSRVLLPNSIAYIGENVSGWFCDFDWISSIFREKDGAPHRIIECFRSTNYSGPFVFPVDKDSAECFDRVVAEGKYEINREEYENYQMTVSGRIVAALYRIVDKENPVVDELRPAFKDLLEKRVTKCIKFAEEAKAPEYILAMKELGAINEANMAKIKKLLKASKVPEIQNLSEALDKVEAAPTKEVDTGGEYAKLLNELSGKISSDKMSVYQSGNLTLHLNAFIPCPSGQAAPFGCGPHIRCGPPAQLSQPHRPRSTHRNFGPASVAPPRISTAHLA